MKIFHIVTHTMEHYYPSLIDDDTGYSRLQHSVNLFVKQLSCVDTSNEHILVNLSSHLFETHNYHHIDGYEVIVLPAKRYYNEFFQTSVALKKFICEQEWVFHIHGTSNFLFDMISPLLKYKKAIAHHRWGHFTWKAFPISAFKYRVCMKRSLQNYHTIIVENAHIQQRFLQEYILSEKSVTVIPWTVDTSFFTQKTEYKKIKNIVYVGRIEKNKWIFDLIESFQRIWREDIFLDIIWTWSMLSYLRTSFSHMKNIRIHGYLSQEEIVRILHNSDIYVHPSYSDSFWLTLAEAMSTGLIVVSAKVSGPLEILSKVPESSRRLFSAGNVWELRDELEKVLDIDEEKQKILWLENRQAVVDNFTFSAVYPRIRDIYDSL